MRENFSFFHTVCGLPLRISWNRLSSKSLSIRQSTTLSIITSTSASSKSRDFDSYVFAVLADRPFQSVLTFLLLCHAAISRNFCHSTSQKIETRLSIISLTAISRNICHSTSVENCSPALNFSGGNDFTENFSLFECLKVLCQQRCCL